NRIKSYLKRQSFEENYREGITRLEKAARSEHLKLGGVRDNEILAKVARALHYKSAPELLAAVGYGEHSVESILKRIRADLEVESGKSAVKESEVVSESLSGAASALLHRKVKTGGEEAAATTAGGLEFTPAS